MKTLRPDKRVVTALNEGQVAEHTYTHANIKSVFDIIDQVQRFINTTIRNLNRTTFNYNEFYIGITEDLDVRLKTHHVTEGNNCETWDCDSEYISREAEMFFTKFKNTQGDGGGGQNNPRFLYCYFITNNSVQ